MVLVYHIMNKLCFLVQDVTRSVAKWCPLDLQAKSKMNRVNLKVAKRENFELAFFTLRDPSGLVTLGLKQNIEFGPDFDGFCWVFAKHFLPMSQSSLKRQKENIILTLCHCTSRWKKSTKTLSVKMRQISLGINQSCSNCLRVHIIPRIS